ncbi:MAG: tryptophan 7-halogenase [Gammaproteobacteria bacterium]|nr:tryptophan 7-halogenase [Gammaproteobacteria bacterium]
MDSHYDVVIAGGGLAGLTLALQLKQRNPALTIFIAEKSKKPAPEASHKVGESSVEIASHYFRNSLKLDSILDQQLPKYGLRFYFSQHGNHNIEQRFELGANQIPSFRSYQIDRGRFENQLLERCQSLGIHVSYGNTVTRINLGQQRHEIEIKQLGNSQSISCCWLIDASGRRALLKHQLNLFKPSNHQINAVWFRIDSTLDINTWSSDPYWQKRVSIPRLLGTNHLVGKGYWIWIIPLSSDATSIGIVTDASLHDFDSLNAYQKALAWMHHHEPQCAGLIQKTKPIDFLCLQQLALQSKQLYSDQGWFITGDAGLFADPLYSSGNDFIAINNTLITDLITGGYSEKAFKQRLQFNQHLMHKLFLGFMQIYQNQYPILGNARIMTLKIIWDFSVYWGSIALIFIQNRIDSNDFMETASRFLSNVFSVNFEVQTLLRDWASRDNHQLQQPGFVNYSAIPFLQGLNNKFEQAYKDDELLAELNKNYQLLTELASELRFQASLEYSDLISQTSPSSTPDSCHLQTVFEQLKTNSI